MEYYIINPPAQEPVGPYKLNELIANGLTADSMVWHDGMANWLKATEVTEVAALLNGGVTPTVVPGAEAESTRPAEAPGGETYYLAVNGQHQGPYTASQLRQQGVLPSSLVWRRGMSEWLPISEIPTLSHNVFGEDAGLYGKTTVVNDGDVNPYMPDESPETEHPLEEPVSECPPSHLAFGIIGLILFFPLGIGALVKATLVSKRWSEKRYGDAVWLSKGAKSMGITAIIIGAIFNFLYILFVMSVRL